MRILRALGRVGLGALVLSSAVLGMGRSAVDAGPTPAPAKAGVEFRTAVLTLVAVFLVMTAGGFLFLVSGIYRHQADKPHFAPVRWVLETERTRSVEFHSRGILAPNLDDDSHLQNGFILYRKNW